MESLRLSRELTQSYPDRAEVQDFFHLLSRPVTRPLLQGLSRSGLRPPDFTAGRRRGPAGAKPSVQEEEGKARESGPHRYSQHGFTPDTSLPSSEPLPRQPATPGFRWDIPSSRGAPGAADPAEAPHTHRGLARPGPGLRARAVGFYSVLFLARPRPPPAPSAPVLDFIH